MIGESWRDKVSFTTTTGSDPGRDRINRPSIESERRCVSDKRERPDVFGHGRHALGMSAEGVGASLPTELQPARTTLRRTARRFAESRRQVTSGCQFRDAGPKRW